MTTVTGTNAVFLAVWDRLAGMAGDTRMQLFTERGAVEWPVKDATRGLAAVITAFYLDNGRAPAVLLNDGKPARFMAQLLAAPDFGKVVAQRTRMVEYFIGVTDANDTGMTVTNLGFPFIAFPVLTESGAHNIRPESEAPILAAAPSWLVMLVAATHPHFLIATDDGVMLTPDGVLMVERSLTHWATLYVRATYPGAVVFGAGIAQASDVFGAGPVLFGLPVAMLDPFKKAYERFQNRDGLFTTVLKDVARYALMFAGFYAGVAGLNGMLGGVFSMSNLSASLKLAGQFGVDTGKLGSLASLGSSLTSMGDKVLNAIARGGAMLDWGNLPSGGVEVSLGDLGADDFDFGDFDPDFVDPNSVDYGWDSFDPFADDFSALGELEFSIDSSASFTAQMFADPGQLPGDLMTMDANGNVQLPFESGYEYVDTNISITPEQAQIAAQSPNSPAVREGAREIVAQRMGTTAQEAAKSPSLWASVNSMANDLIKLAGAYYAVQNQQAVAQRTLANGGRVASYTGGTRTITYPNGQTVTIPTTGGGSIIPGVSNQTLMIGAGALAIGAIAYTLARRKN